MDLSSALGLIVYFRFSIYDKLHLGIVKTSFASAPGLIVYIVSLQKYGIGKAI